MNKPLKIKLQTGNKGSCLLSVFHLLNPNPDLLAIVSSERHQRISPVFDSALTHCFVVCCGQPDLAGHEAKLMQKIQLLCVMEVSVRLSSIPARRRFESMQIETPSSPPDDLHSSCQPQTAELHRNSPECQNPRERGECGSWRRSGDPGNRPDALSSSRWSCW